MAREDRRGDAPRKERPAPHRGGLGRRGWVEDPLEGSSDRGLGKADETGAPETRHDPDPATRRD